MQAGNFQLVRGDRFWQLHAKVFLCISNEFADFFELIFGSFLILRFVEL